MESQRQASSMSSALPLPTGCELGRGRGEEEEATGPPPPPAVSPSLEGGEGAQMCLPTENECVEPNRVHSDCYFSLSLSLSLASPLTAP
jgi:hypothetical protein